MSGALTDHKQIYRAQVVFNTVVNNEGIIVGGSHPMGPIDSVIAYNVVQGSGPLIIEMAGSARNRYVGNIVNGGNVGSMMGPEAIKTADPKLTKIGDVFKIGAGSPLLDAGDATMFPFVTDDIDGKPRNKADVGADEWSMAPAKYGLLGESNVGPMAP